MSHWQWILGPASGGHALALTEARQRQVTFKLGDASEASFVIDGRAEVATEIDELAADLHVARDGVTLYRGRIGATGDDLATGQHRVDVRTSDYRELLTRRLLYDDSKLAWTNIDQALIAWELIEQTQTRTGGALGIVRGLGQTTGVLRDRTYDAGDVIGQRLAELGNVLNGFDWDITPNGQTELRLDIWHPRRGTDRGVVMEYGGNVSRVRREVNPGSYANAIRVTGEAPTTAEVRQAADLAARPEGRWDGVYGFPTISLQSTLAQRADWQIDDAQQLEPTYTLTMNTDRWEGPSHIWLGDTVNLRVPSGRLMVDTLVRVHEIAVSLTEAGGESVQMTVGAIPPDTSARGLSRRLRDLERR